MENPIFKEITDKFTTSRDSRMTYESKWNELYDMYRFKRKKSRPGRANFYIPHAFSNVETVFPRMTSKRPRIQAKPVGPEDAPAAAIMEKLIDYSWEKLYLDDIVRRWVKGSLIYGTGIIKVTWKKQTVTKKTRQSILDEEGNLTDYQDTEELKTVYDDPEVTNCDLRDIYLDMDGVDEKTCRYIIHRYWATKSDLESNPNYKKSDLKRVQYGATNEMIRRGLTQEERQKGGHTAEVLEYWENDRLVVVAGGVVLRDEPNPYDCKKKPFVIMVDQIDDQTVYGIGEVEPIEGLQSEMNTLRNQRMDFNNLTLNPTFKVLPGAVTDIDNIIFAPGHKILMNTADPSAITPIEMPQAPYTSYKEEESIRVDLQTITGVTDYSRGSDAQSMNETATGISLIQEAANERFKAKIRNMESGLQKLGELLRDLYQQYITQEKVFRITQDENDYFYQITPDDIQGEFDIMIEGGSTIPSNKMQTRSEEMNKYNVLMANPLIQGSPQSMLEITRALLEAWEDPKKDAILESLEAQVQQIQEQQAQVEEQQAMDQQEMMLEKQMAEELNAQAPNQMEQNQEQMIMQQMMGGQGGGTETQSAE